MPVATAEQFELISDDPRCGDGPGVLAELRSFRDAAVEMGGLLTQSQAARFIGCDSVSVGDWVKSGRLTSRVVAGVKMVSAAEVVLLYRERVAGVVHRGGRGIKAPTLREMAKDAWADMMA